MYDKINDFTTNLLGIQMYASCLDKQRRIKDIFNKCPNQESKYQKIIELGKEQPRLDLRYKIPENIVQGCQSTVYLHANCQDNFLFFAAESDALISAGLAALLICVYSGELPETILKCPPAYLEEIGIIGNLTPNRANGLLSIHLRMKQEALKFLMRVNHKQ